ncbi:MULTISPECIES: DUF805 domain-containing protein [Pseudomonas]|jgi:uncharacterized membrane protein YhaH (DUF805 family)|uniref:DUF805 domain-containing protein n=2 Tax=Pseudomonas TaxID=286 RepID=A0A4Y9TEP6_PSEFL|nr:MULTISPECIES: DUF805 domain-containing protein [Pseudomonas]CRM93887.1 putative membrane protein [Pseudomonas sp. 22 E 5]QXH66985.1 DUF805 domain-containing protein [Pseudomonas asgharzadehiana]TFW42478.1 DUF805 domain-containing protein [Pseudomonas fluorescens]TKJ62653.1 DUF805 domain-containing protein [Pseudomonas sp. CFBP13506]CRM07628.1 putative membrane protein [Pseudomonas sp. 31 E 6]
MSDNRFKIVFDGALLPGVESTTAKLNLAELFKSSVEDIEKLFTGRPVALKRDLSRPDAETYLTALKNAGIDARIEAEQPVAFSLAETHETDSGAADFSRPAASPYAPPRATVGENLPEYAELKVFTINGRIGRLRYLAWTLVLTVAMLVAAGIISTVGFAIATASPTIAIILGSLLGFALFVALVVVSVQIGVQRLHDLGWSGWLYLLNLVPLVNSIFPLLLLVLPGNAGANQYGAPPPRNSTAVKVLASLWLAFIPLMLIIVVSLGMNGYLDQLESNVDSSYESSSITSDEDADQSVIVEEEDAQSADEAAEPVDSPEEQ